MLVPWVKRALAEKVEKKKVEPRRACFGSDNSSTRLSTLPGRGKMFVAENAVHVVEKENARSQERGDVSKRNTKKLLNNSRSYS